MGYALGTGFCFTCHRVFSFNPVRVPSIRVRGSREPICEDCMIRANKIRVDRGLEPHPIYADAYQPCNEEDLP